MDELVPVRLIGGRAPLLSAFMGRRAAMRKRARSLYQATTALPIVPASYLREMNELADILMGRKPA